MAYTRTQSLPFVCKETFAMYFQPYFRHNHNSMTHGVLNDRLAVNFAYDIFYFIGENENLDHHLEEKLLPLRKIYDQTRVKSRCQN
jgi:hypothetical protein